MKTWLITWCLVLWASSALAITNGTAELLLDANTPAGYQIEVEYASFQTAGVRTAFKTVGIWTVGTDGKLHSLVTWPAAPPDNEADHWMCAWARYVKAGGPNSEWGEGSCNQVPVPPIVVVPPPPPPPPPTPAPPTGLQLASVKPTEIIITASAKDCPRITTSTKGSTSTQLKRTVVCTK